MNLMTCSFEDLSKYGVAESVVRRDMPQGVHWKTFDAAREVWLSTCRVVRMPGTTVDFRYYDPDEVQALYQALENGWKPQPKPKLQLQFKSLTQEQYDLLAKFATDAGIPIHVPKKRPPKAENGVVDPRHIEVSEEDEEFNEEEVIDQLFN